PTLVQNFVGGDAARGAEFYGLFGTAWALMQFIFAPVQGSLSDRFGRRTVILISCTGLGLDFILMALAPNLWWLFLGRMISGIAAASFSTAGAYISDVTPPEKRAASFGLIGAAFGVGFVVGPALGGLLGAVSPRLPFWASAFMALMNVCWGLFVLPESLPKEKRVPFSWKSANPLGSLKLLRSHPLLTGLAGSYFLINLGHAVLPSTTVLYMNYRFGWDSRAVGIVLAGVGICSLLVQGFLVKPAGGEAAQGKARAGGGFDFWRRGIRHLRPRTDRSDILDRRAGNGFVGHRHPLAAGHHDEIGGRDRTGALAGGAREPAGVGESHRSDHVHPDIRRVHQHARRVETARRALPAGGAAVVYGDAAGMAYHPAGEDRGRDRAGVGCLMPATLVPHPAIAD